jgi:pyruvate formate lyase activating enzyme
MKQYNTAVIFDIARCSVHDGPGVRTVVYFKGCPLSCKWCHNPEGISDSPQLVFYSKRCIGCGRCTSICPCHGIADGGHVIDRQNCRVCGRCADACPADALHITGREATLDGLMAEIRKDRLYYENGGGVTASGGEALLQADFVAALFGLCRAQKIHTAIETALDVQAAEIDKVLGVCDMFIVDCKHPDPEMHRYYTGRTNERIWANTQYVASRHDNVLIRIPLIPGVNDDIELLHASVSRVLSLGGSIKGVELLKYNNLAVAKYNGLEKNHIVFADKPQTNDEMTAVCDELNNRIKRANYVFFKK